MEEEILATLIRYIDRYQWRWNLAKRVINLYFGTQYTEKELKRLYKQYRQRTGPECVVSELYPHGPSAGPPVSTPQDVPAVPLRSIPK